MKNSKGKKPFIFLHVLLLALSVAAFMHMSFLQLMGDPFTNYSTWFSFLFMMMNIVVFFGYRMSDFSSMRYYLATVSLFAYLFFHLTGNFGGPAYVKDNHSSTLVIIILIMSLVSFVIKGRVRYILLNGIYFGVWVLLGVSYLYLVSKYGSSPAVGLLFSPFGLQFLLKFSWFAFVFPLFMLPFIVFMIPVKEPVKSNTNSSEGGFYGMGQERYVPQPLQRWNEIEMMRQEYREFYEQQRYIDDLVDGNNHHHCHSDEQHHHHHH